MPHPRAASPIATIAHESQDLRRELAEALQCIQAPEEEAQRTARQLSGSDGDVCQSTGRWPSEAEGLANVFRPKAIQDLQDVLNLDDVPKAIDRAAVDHARRSLEAEPPSAANAARADTYRSVP